MRILVDNGAYDLRNMGDVAMLQVMVKRFLEQWPEAEVTVFSEAPGLLREFCPQTAPLPFAGRRLWLQGRNVLGGLYNLAPEKASSRLEGLEDHIRNRWPGLAAWWIRRRLKRRTIDAFPMTDFLAAVRQADIVVASGGGYLNDAFEEHAGELLDMFRFAQALGKQTALFGQGLGPIETPGLRSKARAALAGMDLITVREERTALPLLKTLGISTDNVVVTGDDAIEPAYHERPAQLGDGLGVNLRIAPYSGVGPDHVEQVRAALKTAVTAHGARVVSVPISRYESESDEVSVGTMLADISVEVDSGEDLDTPLKVIRQVGRCRLVVTGSYHAGVFALAQGIPTVGLAQSVYYANKFLGLAEQFTTGCSVVDLDGDGLVERLAGAIGDAWHSAEGVRPRLLEAAERQIEDGRAAYKQFFGLVMNRGVSS
jgi:colanic acid/amylovoran biosynthesis protein